MSSKLCIQFKTEQRAVVSCKVELILLCEMDFSLTYLCVHLTLDIT